MQIGLRMCIQSSYLPHACRLEVVLRVAPWIEAALRQDRTSLTTPLREKEEPQESLADSFLLCLLSFGSPARHGLAGESSSQLGVLPPLHLLDAALMIATWFEAVPSSQMLQYYVLGGLLGLAL